MNTRIANHRQFLLQLRWILLLVFPPAFVLGPESAPDPQWHFALCVIAMAAGYVLLRQLEDLTPLNAAVWLALVLFIALYFFRYCYLVVDPTPLMRTLFDDAYASITRRPDLLQWAFTQSVTVFTVFCLASAWLLRRGTSATGVPLQPGGTALDGVGGKLTQVLIVVLPLLMLVLGYVAHKYHIGQMGVAPGDPLPFRLKGVIFHARYILLPLLILLLILLGRHAGNSAVERLGFLLLLVHAASDMVLRGSRSSLLLGVLLIVFLVAAGGARLRRADILASAGVGVAAVWLTPLILHYRVLRSLSNDGIFAILQQVPGRLGGNLIDLLRDGVAFVYFRLPGIETAWTLGSYDAKPLGAQLLPTVISKYGITGYLNFDIYKIPVEAYTLFAPGFVGWLYLAGGISGLVIGALALSWLCSVLPGQLYDRGLKCAPVANVFLLWMIFLALTDGTVDSLGFMIVVGLMSLTVIEILLRRFGGSRDNAFAG